MFRPTNRCQIIVRLNCGIHVEGFYHQPADASPAVRPFDALRDMKAGMLLVADAQVRTTQEVRQCCAVVIPREAIALIELPKEGWEPGRAPGRRP